MPSVIDKPVDSPIDNNDRDDDMLHVFCGCRPMEAFCGTHLTSEIYDLEEELDCVVCAAMEYLPCPFCGV